MADIFRFQGADLGDLTLSDERQRDKLYKKNNSRLKASSRMYQAEQNIKPSINPEKPASGGTSSPYNELKGLV